MSYSLNIVVSIGLDGCPNVLFIVPDILVLLMLFGAILLIDDDVLLFKEFEFDFMPNVGIDVFNNEFPYCDWPVL